jgi:hypothetical protein
MPDTRVKTRVLCTKYLAVHVSALKLLKRFCFEAEDREKRKWRRGGGRQIKFMATKVPRQ